MKRRILVFIQAAADVRHALSLIEKHEGYFLHLCVINVESIYLFLHELKIKNVLVSFVKVKQFRAKKPLYYFTAKRILRKKTEEISRNINPDKIYFFSRFYDWVTTGIICRLLRTKNIITVVYYDHQDHYTLVGDCKLKRFSTNYIKSTFIAILRTFVSGAKIVARYKTRSEEFAYWLYPIEYSCVTDKVLVSDKLKYALETQVCKGAILFYVSPDEILLFNKELINLISEVVLKFKSLGFKTLLKGHPRLGEPKELLNMVDEVIPSYIPSEFVNYTNVVKVIGLISSSIGNCAIYENVEVISLMHMSKFVKNENKSYYETYLNALSKGSVRFPKTIQEIIDK